MTKTDHPAAPPKFLSCPLLRRARGGCRRRASYTGRLRRPARPRAIARPIGEARGEARAARQGRSRRRSSRRASRAGRYRSPSSARTGQATLADFGPRGAAQPLGDLVRAVPGGNAGARPASGAKGGPSFEVVAVNVDTARLERRAAFLNSIGVKALARYADPSGDAFEALRKDGKALGLPVSLLIDKDGCEIGVGEGAVKWIGRGAGADRGAEGRVGPTGRKPALRTRARQSCSRNDRANLRRRLRVARSAGRWRGQLP